MADPTAAVVSDCLDEVIVILADPATSYWLRNAIVSAIDRDPVDAERDALVLAKVLTKRLDAFFARQSPLAE